MDYFTVSKKERTGMLFLISLIVMIWLLPKYFGSRAADPDQLERMHAVRLEKEEKIMDSVGVKKEIRLFPFDPNTASDEDWLRLGLHEKNIRTIRNYLDKGGRFREAEELGKIYGLREDVVERLVPFVRIRKEQKIYETRRKFTSGENSYRAIFAPRNSVPSGDHPYEKKFTPRRPVSFGDQRYEKTFTARRSGGVLELNRADTSALIDLPGIGPTLARRITIFRDRCGGFYSMQQLAEVYGLKDTVFEQLRTRLSLDPLLIRPLKINQLGQDSLQWHPYINYAEARAIIKYRQQHGPFQSASDLLNIALITEAWVTRIGPYLDYSTAD